MRKVVVLFAVGVWIAGCGLDEYERNDVIYDDGDDDECEESCDDSDSSGDDRTASASPPDSSPAEEREGKSEEGVSYDDVDLQCADDASICRYCGPSLDVVEDCPEGDDSFECQVLELVNEERVAEGLNALDYDATLAQSAMIHAMDLSMCDYFAHDSLDGTSFFERCEDNGYDGTCTGENIGGGQQNPQAVFDAWMESPGHRDNILYPHHTELGVAYYEGEGTYSRYWLKHFGRDD